MLFCHNSCRCESTLATSWAVLEAAWKLVLLFWRRLEQSLTLLGGGLKLRVDWRTILMRLGGGLEASCGRFERVLEPSWRRLGGVLELPRRFFVVLDMVSHSLSILRRIFGSMKDDWCLVFKMK